MWTTARDSTAKNLSSEPHKPTTNALLCPRDNSDVARGPTDPNLSAFFPWMSKLFPDLEKKKIITLMRLRGRAKKGFIKIQQWCRGGGDVKRTYEKELAKMDLSWIHFFESCSFCRLHIQQRKARRGAQEYKPIDRSWNKKTEFSFNFLPIFDRIS